MKENKSLMRKVEKLHEQTEGESLFDHIMIMIEVDDNGIPTGNITKFKGRPFAVLGMIDMLQEKLSRVRESILEKFDRAEAASQSLQELPTDVINKVQEFEQRAREAAKNNDMDSLEKIKDEANEYLSKIMKGQSDSDDDSDDDDDMSGGFNINDFKGSF